MSQSPSPCVTAVQIEEHVFPPSATAPGSTSFFFLAGAGERGLEIQGKFIKFTEIGVYLEAKAVSSLASKWKGKSAEELTESVGFFRDIVSGPFEKFTQVRMILPLTGKQYSEKVSENCVAYWKSIGTYTEAETSAIQKFVEVFETKNFSPGASILFTQSPNGSLSIGFSFDGAFPESGEVVIENKQLSEAVLESIIGIHGVSPAAKRSLAVRLSQLFNTSDNEPKAKDPTVVTTEEVLA